MSDELPEIKQIGSVHIRPGPTTKAMKINWFDLLSSLIGISGGVALVIGMKTCVGPSAYDCENGKLFMYGDVVYKCEAVMEQQSDE